MSRKTIAYKEAIFKYKITILDKMKIFAKQPHLLYAKEMISVEGGVKEMIFVEGGVKCL